MTRQAPRWPLLTPHRENHRLQRRNRSGSPAGGHTRAFLGYRMYRVQETTAAVGAEAPILFRAPSPLVPLARIHAARLQLRTGSGTIPRASLVLQDAFFSRFALASVSDPGLLFSRSSLGVQGRFSLCSLFVRRGVSRRYLIATGSRQLRSGRLR